MDFWERLEKATDSKIERKRLTAMLGIASNSITTWKKRKTYPAADVVVNLAKVLGTTVEELVTGQAPTGSLPGEMLQLARDIASLPQDDIDELKAIVALKKEKHRGAKAKASAS